jgi:hypothetical protein
MPEAWREGLEGVLETLCDFSLFPQLKTVLKERKFSDITMIEGILRDAHARFRTLHYMKCFK